MEKHHHNPQYSTETPTEKMGGMELREEEKIWRETASSESRIMLMKKMIKEDLAFADLEQFGQEFSDKLKSNKMKNKSLHKKVTQPIMMIKLADEQTLKRDLHKAKMKRKRILATEMGGEKTRMYRRAMKHLNEISRETKKISKKSQRTCFILVPP